MHIMVILLKEGGSVDSESLLGHIAIADGRQTVKANYTYIDSWFDALIRGAQAIQEGSRSVIDLIDEPEPLIFELSPEEVSISYGDTTLRVGPFEDFAASLRCAATLFWEAVCEEVDVTSEALRNIRVFVSA